MASNTSSKVIQRYKEKVYKRVVADLPKKLVEEWENKLKNDNLSKQSFIKQAIQRYLAED